MQCPHVRILQRMEAKVGGLAIHVGLDLFCEELHHCNVQTRSWADVELALEYHRLKIAREKAKSFWDAHDDNMSCISFGVMNITSPISLL